MKTFIFWRKFSPHLFAATVSLFAVIFVKAQVVRPYGPPVYSDNLKGGHTMFGNTITAIYTSGSGSTGVVNTAAMNDFDTSGTGSYTNSRTSAFHNNSSNIQLVDVDGVIAPATIIASGATWNYSNADAQPASWPNVSTLPDGPGASPLGYGPTGAVGTTLTDHRTYYFTKTVNFNPASYSGFTFNLTLDDGAVVYVNGTEVGRINMPSGTPVFTTNASSNIEPEQASSFTVGAGAPFVNGDNTIQVEVHTSASNESGTDDLFFDLQLMGNDINNTTSSSSADLILPAVTNTIKFARLYWGGRISGGTGGAANINLRTVKIRKGVSGSYTTITAPVAQVDKSLISSSDSAYQSYIDITAFINTNGAGTYTVADVKAASGSVSAGNYAAWSIVVVYENLSLPFSSVRVYDGFLQVFNNGAQTITLTGLNAPANPMAISDAYMTVMTWEGDADLAITTGNPNGDYVKVNGNVVSKGVNRAANFWNGTISKNGAFITTKNPDFKNQMSIDLDELEVGTGYGILPNSTSVSVEFGSEADQYFPSVLAFTMRTKDPTVTLDKTVADSQAPFNILNPNEILTYTLSGSNNPIGGNALNTVIADTIPGALTYVPGSLKINSSPGGFTGPKTDLNNGDDQAYLDSLGSKKYVKFFIGTGSTGSAGGILLPGESYSVEFKCLTPLTTNALNSVSNTARIAGISVGGDPFVDDGTAIIGPPGSPLAVKMTAFFVKKENNDAVLRWTTAFEIKNDHFEVERSFDGISFSKIGAVNGNGSTSETKYYQYNDPINTMSKIIYYRLRTVDIDDKGSYTMIVALRLNGLINLNNFTVYPNPFSGDLKLQISSAKETEITIRINNIAGQQLINRKVTLQPGENIIVLKDLEALKPGLHLMEIITEEGKLTQKIIKR